MCDKLVCVSRNLDCLQGGLLLTKAGGHGVSQGLRSASVSPLRAAALIRGPDPARGMQHPFPVQQSFILHTTSRKLTLIQPIMSHLHILISISIPGRAS